MAKPSLTLFHNNLSSPISVYSPKRFKNLTLTTNSHFPSPDNNSLLNFKKQSLLPNLRFKNPVVFAAQYNFFKVIRTVWKVGKDGIEAGTNLVPDSVPRPIARISVTVAMLAVSLFVLKSSLSTAFSVLAMMGLIYFIFIALNKDQGPKGGGDTTSEDPLEEARRIMEKYK